MKLRVRKDSGLYTFLAESRRLDDVAFCVVALAFFAGAFLLSAFLAGAAFAFAAVVAVVDLAGAAFLVAALGAALELEGAFSFTTGFFAGLADLATGLLAGLGLDAAGFAVLESGLF